MCLSVTDRKAWYQTESFVSLGLGKRHVPKSELIIKIVIGTWLVPSERSQLCFKLLQQVKDLTAFEEIGLQVKLMAIDKMLEHVACHSTVEGCEYLP